MTTDIYNLETPKTEDDDLLPGEPSVHEVVEFSIAVSLDLEASLDEDENPFESVGTDQH